MSFLDTILGNIGGENTNSKIEWKQLTDLNQLDVIVDESATKSVLIFKHSTRCSISRFALRQFENEFSLEHKIIPYLLDLLNHRAISNEIVFKFGIQHQSPQVLLIKNGVVVYHESHEGIDATDLNRFV